MTQGRHFTLPGDYPLSTLPIRGSSFKSGFPVRDITR